MTIRRPDLYCKRFTSEMCTAEMCQELVKVIILGTNGVAVARYGLIFSEDGATGSRKVFRYLWGLWDAI